MTTKEDKELFQKKMRGVTPLKKRPARVLHQKTTSRVKNNSKHAANNCHTNTIELTTDISISCSPEEKLFFAQPGLPTKTIRKLRKGQLDFKAKIDLHAMTTEEAKIALQQFLARCQQQLIRTIL